MNGLEVIYLARYAANHHIISNVHVGTRFPAYATALGQALLSDKADTEIVSLYEGQNLTAFTDKTPRSMEELLKRIGLARKQGYVISWGYFEEKPCQYSRTLV